MAAINHQLAERVQAFVEAIRYKKPSLVPHLNRAVISILEYESPLETASRENLIALKGVSQRNVDYLLRIFRGDDVAAVARDVPRQTYRPSEHVPLPRETGNWDGSWDNAVKRYEDS